MLLAIPGENFRFVFLLWLLALDFILLEEVVDGLVSATASGHVQQLVVVPVLRQHALRPSGLLSKESNVLNGALLADKDTKHDDGVGAPVCLAVEAPLVVRV